MSGRIAKYLLSLEKNSAASNWQIAGIVAGLIFTSVSATVLVVSLGQPRLPPPPTNVNFNLYDAEQICATEMKMRLGKSMLRYHLDAHSSRMDRRAHVYRVYMKADIGKFNAFNEVAVHCFIDLSSHNLEHYRVHGLSDKLNWNTKISFF